MELGTIKKKTHQNTTLTSPLVGFLSLFDRNRGSDRVLVGVDENNKKNAVQVRDIFLSEGNSGYKQKEEEKPRLRSPLFSEINHSPLSN